MNYRWLQNKAGRRTGQVEGLDERDTTIIAWQAWGWIEPVEKPKQPEPRVEAIEEPPADRAYRRTTGRRILRREE